MAVCSTIADAPSHCGRPCLPPELLLCANQVSLFGLTETRKAVASFMTSSATVSEEWDALPTKAAVPRVIDPQGSVWTAPETWVASAARQKAAEEAAAAAAVAGEQSAVVAEEETAPAADLAAEALVAAEAEALDGKKKKAFMADAYAFGMIAWEVSMGMNVAAGFFCLRLALRMRALEA